MGYLIYLYLRWPEKKFQHDAQFFGLLAQSQKLNESPPLCPVEQLYAMKCYEYFSIVL